MNDCLKGGGVSLQLLLHPADSLQGSVETQVDSRENGLREQDWCCCFFFCFKSSCYIFFFLCQYHSVTGFIGKL